MFTRALKERLEVVDPDALAYVELAPRVRDERALGAADVDQRDRPATVGIPNQLRDELEVLLRLGVVVLVEVNSVDRVASLRNGHAERLLSGSMAVRRAHRIPDGGGR
jgi:hypothetical protein